MCWRNRKLKTNRAYTTRHTISCRPRVREYDLYAKTIRNDRYRFSRRGHAILLDLGQQPWASGVYIVVDAVVAAEARVRGPVGLSGSGTAARRRLAVSIAIIVNGVSPRTSGFF